MGIHGWKTISSAVVLGFALIACQKGFSTLDAGDGNNSSQGPGPTIPTPTTLPPANPTFCSYLNFDNVVWNSAFSPWERRSFAISLSLSGSFEGPNGWQNLTNNFDDMGMSAGLLNQTLGTGSLQPLLSKMKSQDLSVFTSNFAQARAESVLGMVTAWERANGISVFEEDISEVTSSRLDRDFVSTLAGESASVTWAKNTLYQSNGKFKPEWATEWTKFLGNPKYVTLQIDAAERIHQKALGYVERIRLEDLRTYLFMFDIVVQNGGLNETEFQEVDQMEAEGRIQTGTEKLMALLQIRLRRVRPQYVEDVRKRKTAIINGTGVVHGSNRNFPREFCFAQTDQIL